MTACMGESYSESFDLELNGEFDPSAFTLDGKTVVFAAVSRNGSNVLFPKFGDYALGDALLSRYSEMEKKHDMDISVVNVDLSAMFFSMTAGSYYADIVNEQMSYFISYMNSGMFYDLSILDGMDITDQDKFGTKAQLDCVTFGDSVYGCMANMMGEPIPYICGYMWFDPYLMKQGSLPSPLEDYERGEWTWDAFFRDCQTVAGPSHNNPDINVYGTFINEGAYDYFVIPAIISNGTHLVNRTENGFVSNIKDEKVIQAIEWIRDISSDDCINVGSGGGVELASQFAHHEYAFYMEYNWIGISRMGGWLGTVAEDEFGWISFPVGPGGTPKQVSSFISWGTNYYLVPAYNDSTYSGFFADELFEPLYTDAGLDWKDILYTENFWEKGSFEQCMKMFTDVSTCYFAITGDSLLTQTLGKAASGKESVSSALESIETRALSKLESMYSNLIFVD